MRFGFDDDQLELQKAVRAFLTDHLPSEAVRAAMQQGYDAGVWRRLVDELGVTAVGFPERLGGTGERLLDQVVVATELGRVLDPGPYLPSVGSVARVLLEVGGEAADAWLEDLVEGFCPDTSRESMGEHASASAPR